MKNKPKEFLVAGKQFIVVNKSMREKIKKY